MGILNAYPDGIYEEDTLPTNPKWDLKFNVKLVDGDDLTNCPLKALLELVLQWSVVSVQNVGFLSAKQYYAIGEVLEPVLKDSRPLDPAMELTLIARAPSRDLRRSFCAFWEKLI